MKKNLFILAMIMGLASISFTVINPQGQKPWPVPDNFKKMKNPIASDATSIADGKALWSTHCKSCHGSKGLGDGPKAAQLKTESGDFSKADIQSQTDGSIFYKISEGRDDMPNFKKKMPEADERWSLVIFMRTLKK